MQLLHWTWGQVLVLWLKSLLLHTQQQKPPREIRSWVKYVPLYINVDLKKRRQYKETNELLTVRFFSSYSLKHSIIPAGERKQQWDTVYCGEQPKKRRCKLITVTSLKTREWERRKVKVKHFLRLRLLSFLKSLPPPCHHHHHHHYHLHTLAPSPLHLLSLSLILLLHSLWVKEGKVIVMKWPREAWWQPSPDKLFLTGF